MTATDLRDTGRQQQQQQWGRRAYDQEQFGGQQFGGRQQQSGSQQLLDQSGRQLDRRTQGSGSMSKFEDQAVMETTWDALDTAGAYVEIETGDLFRVPQEAVIPGASPIIQRISHGYTRLLRVSDDPYTPILRARVVAANHDIQPNF